MLGTSTRPSPLARSSASVAVIGALDMDMVLCVQRLEIVRGEAAQTLRRSGSERVRKDRGSRGRGDRKGSEQVIQMKCLV